MRMDEKFIPDPGLLFEAVTRTDKRLRFNIGKTPELVLAQPKMDAEQALETSIYIMTKVHEEIVRLKDVTSAGKE